MTVSVLEFGKATISTGEDGTPVVTLDGEINYESASGVRDVVQHLVDKGHKCINVSCSSASFIDSSGISALVTCARQLSESGGKLRLIAITRQLRHALEVSGFMGLFSCNDASMFPLHKYGECRRLSRMWQSTAFSIRASADSDGTIRRKVTEMAKSLPFTDEQIEDIQLAVGEAVANAYRHGCMNRDTDRISVRCIGDETLLTVEITNPGPRFEPDRVPAPDPTNPKEGGMGIFFMKAVMDSVEFSFSDVGTTVRMIKLVKPNHGGSFG